jgi:metallo-beta-lactamase class B
MFKLKPPIFSLPKIIYLCLIVWIGYGAGLALAQPVPGEPFPAFRIAGNLYYVGTGYQASYFIVTPKGNILINSGYKTDVPLIKASVEKLGFKFDAIKILLISHAHSDHDAGSALIKALTGASYQVMDVDVPVVESGGKADFNYGNDVKEQYEPVKVDRVLHDGDEVKLGKVILHAHLTAGHTQGCTTWTLKVRDQGKSYNVVIVGGPYVNPGYKLVNNAAYPAIAADYAHMFQVLKSLPCDIFLGAHGLYFGLEKKYALMEKGQPHPFVDPLGYKNFIAAKERDFHTEMERQNKGN